MSDWDKPLETKESNAWTTFANKERNSSNSHQSAGHGQGFQNSNRGRGRGRGGNFGGRPQQRSNQYPNNHAQQNSNQYNRWNNQQESNRKPTNDNSWSSTRNDNNHTNNTNDDNGWNNASSSQVINNSTQEQGWRNNNDNNSWSNTSDAKTSQKHWDNNNSQANEWSSTSKGNTRSSFAAEKQQWNNDSNGWGNSKNSVSNSWGNKTEASTADNANSASGGWGNDKPETQKPTTAAPNNWSSTATTTVASSGGWSSVASKKPAANNWSSQSANSSTTDTNQWSQESTPPSTDEQPSSGGGGWDEKPKSKDVQWGAISLDDLGWNESKQKTSLEPCQGIWKDGVHVLGEDNEKVRLKLFGTLEDKENVHSGINFDKYDNIPVETKGENIPDGIHEFASSGLDKHLLENIEMAHYKVPTPVQKHSIPIVMNGHDLMACAQTGSGKTAGFLFPILSALFSKGPLEDPKEPPIKKGYQFYKKSYPQALILAPTRELASQIFKEAKKFCYRSYVRPCVAYGGADISAQLRLIDRGCHILVATPGRLVDILERRRISFKNIQYLILDEADRMLDMGFEPQVRRIVEGEDMPPPTKRQTLMFSATFPDNIQALARDFLSTYVFLSVGRVGGTSDNITQEIKWVKEEEKKNLLIETLEGKNGRQGLTLVFTQTKRMADSVCRFLNDRNYPATAIHGDRIQSEREAALQSFKQGIAPIMVATAVAARGLDIPNVTHVISFDLPQDIDDYVHRIGRTGRAGNTGYATTFFSSSDKFLAAPLVKLLKDANQDVPGWLDEISREARSF